MLQQSDKFTLCFRRNNKCWSNMGIFVPLRDSQFTFAGSFSATRCASLQTNYPSTPSGREVLRLLLRQRLSHNHRRLKQGALNAAIMGNICWLNHRLCKRNTDTPLARGCKSVVELLLKIYRCACWCFPAHVSMM